MSNDDAHSCGVGGHYVWCKCHETGIPEPGAKELMCSKPEWKCRHEHDSLLSKLNREQAYAREVAEANLKLGDANDALLRENADLKSKLAEYPPHWINQELYDMDRKEWFGMIDRLKADKRDLLEVLQNIHDISFDGDGMASAKELGADIASMAKKVLAKHEGGEGMTSVKDEAFYLLKRLYNEDWMWVENKHSVRGTMDKAIHRILCRAKVNHQCERGQHFTYLRKRP